MADGQIVFGGLNKQGVILFIVLLVLCLPLCWLPWVIDSMKGVEN